MKFKVTARVLHWVSALIIIWATVTGLYLAFYKVDPNIKHKILDFNVSITFVFIPIFVWRVWHRIRNGAPPYASALSSLEIRAASYMHKLLYVLVAGILVSGVLMMNRDFQVFGLSTIPHIIYDREITAFFSLIHNYLSYSLAACVIVHVLAAVKHEFCGTRILRRIV
ncbi:cytochrome b [Arenicella xantha]|uniref:Cytochrome b561 n=1 Tax=Arenicella xantha TaxID=644221 RepID=A0A395JKL4_9GAMM|nr:cytochrome b/b6 domain-containing protein [Arenicella xantha]RBP51109.1 cytochrome b561 [Arenicella xantha]